MLLDILENLTENNSIVAEHGLSSKITQSPGGSSDTSEGSENSGSFEDSGRSDEEYSEDGASCKEGGFEISQWKKAINEEMVSLEKNQTCSLVKILAGKKASQRLWMFKVKEEHNGGKRYKARLEPSYVGTLNDTSTHHKSEGFQLAGQEENLECRLKEILYGLIQALMLRLAKLVRILLSEGSLSLLKILGTKSLAEMFTRERGYSQFNDVSLGYLVSKVSQPCVWIPCIESLLALRLVSAACSGCSAVQKGGATPSKTRFNDSSGRADHAVQIE
ncbi:hypothetical protein Tco_1114016 [Tanacetum coccineum]|uniref:Reverse transcriptase n=1 Tax=Tanacetum coccineum TaxID=301880 RepID=A0ABQ5IWV0_9ASTR